MPTDVTQRHNTLFCGLEIGPANLPVEYGTLACIIRTTGRSAPLVPAGTYFLTNYHVIAHTVPKEMRNGNGTVIQPTVEFGAVPDDYKCGRYVYGLQDPENDCAICSVGYGRMAANGFPR